jgi:preprotein translocase subunit SecE
VVDCDGLENRYGVIAIGGSNPPLSASNSVKELTTLFIWVAVIGVAFAVLWRKGHLVRLSTYVQETREELKKCTWPTLDELKGSTLVVMVATVLLGVFCVVVDRIFFQIALWLT